MEQDHQERRREDVLSGQIARIAFDVAKLGDRIEEVHNDIQAHVLEDRDSFSKAAINLAMVSQTLAVHVVAGHPDLHVRLDSIDHALTTLIQESTSDAAIRSMLRWFIGVSVPLLVAVLTILATVLFRH